MKNIQQIIKIFFLLLLVACTENDLRDVSFVNDITAPANVAAVYNITQDNTGSVTITPNADGAVSFEIFFGDGTTAPAIVPQGESAFHVYAEGTYQVKIVAVNLTGVKTEATQQLIVSFKAPQNLVVVVENDAAISKQVNITANADFATFFEFNSGETGVTQPVVSGNIGSTISYTYQNAGTYDIMVEAKGGAIATTKYEVSFEVTEILAPIASAPTPPSRSTADVVSIFSDVYTDVSGSNFYPNWGQATQYTAFDLNGDAIIQYTNLNYQGIDIGSEIDASSMETLHIDIWTADATSINVYPLPNGVQPADERFVTLTLVPNQWNSFDIPMTDFTNQGLPTNNLKQFKFVGSGTVFIDNLYFFKAPSVPFNGITPITFEDNFTLSSFDGGAISAIDNPDASGINTSSRVFEMVKNAGQPWAGSKITLSENFDLSNPIVKAKVWSPRAGLNLLLKFEDATPWPNTKASAEITGTTTSANAWEELTFDFTGIDTAIDFNNLVLIMDNGTQGDGSSNFTIYVDDITTSPVLNLEPNVGLSSFDGGAISIIDNPDTSGNNSLRVVKMVKSAGQPWAGSKITVNSPFTFVGGTGVKVKVWSPRAGLKLLLKFEDATPWPNTKASAEVTATSTIANGWEELSFSFAGITTTVDFNNLVLIMDNGTQGDGSSNYTIYLDDITQF